MPRKNEEATLLSSARHNDDDDNVGVAVDASAHDALHSALHYDMYATEYGSGTPLYASSPSSAVATLGDNGNDDEDAGGLRAVAYTDNNNGSRHGHKTPAGVVTTAQDMTFRTRTGAPASHELWRFRRRGCQDAWAAVLFVATVLLVVTWGGAQLWQMQRASSSRQRLLRLVYGVSGNDSGHATRTRQRMPHNADASPHTTTAAAALVLPALYACGLLALAVAGALLALQCLQRWPRRLITAQCWLQAGVLLVSSLYFGLAGAMGAAAVSLLVAALTLLWLYLIRDRIPFSAALLAVAATLVRRHSYSLVAVALGAALLLVLYTTLTLMLLTPVLLRAVDEAERQQQAQQQQQVQQTASLLRQRDVAYALLACVALFWVEQVLVNVVHVVTAGVTATWYFAGRAVTTTADDNGNANDDKKHGHNTTAPSTTTTRVTRVPRGVVRAALSRATTTSFGSICLGSLLVAVIRFVRFLANAMAQSSSFTSDGGGGGIGFVSCVALCLLACLEAVVQYFNEYAFVHCAIYGCAYVEAAQRTWRLTQQCFFAALFNDALVSQATSLLTLFVALALAGGVLLVTWSLAAATVALTLSFAVTQTVLQLAQSVVTTLFVCFAEVPEGMRLSFPELYDELLRTDAGMTHHTNVYVHDGDDSRRPQRREQQQQRVEAMTYGSV